MVGAAHPVNFDQVIAAHLRVTQQQAFDLLGEEVDAFDFEHVVVAAGDALDAEGGTAAATPFPAQHFADVPGAETNQRQPFAGECRHHHFAPFAISHWLVAVGVYEFNQVMVFPHVDAGMSHAVNTHAHPGRFGHADDVEGFNAHDVLDALAQFVAPDFGAEDAHAQFGVGVEIEPFFGSDFYQAQGVGGDGGNGRCAQILHKLQLQLRPSRADRNDHRLQRSGAVMKTKPAVEKAKRGGNLQDIFAGDGSGRQAAGHDVAPLLHVSGRVGADDGRAGRAGTHVHAHELGLWRASQAEGIGFAQGFFGHEGKLAQIVQAVYIICAQPAQMSDVARIVGVDVAQSSFQPFQLERGQLVAGHRFKFWLIHIVVRPLLTVHCSLFTDY